MNRIEEYGDWILKNYPTQESALGKCEEACLRMKQAFPELEIIYGQIEVEEPDGCLPTKTIHCWFKTNNNIIDPTKHQYPSRILSYRPVDKSKGKPTGKCYNCGNLTYNFRQFCCKICEKLFLEDIEKEIAEYEDGDK